MDTKQHHHQRSARRGWRSRVSGLGAVALLATTMALVATGSMPASAANGVVTGTVFRDFNSDGFMNTSASGALPAVDVGVAGVTVKAYDAAGTKVDEQTTAANGTYTLSYTTGDATTNVRIEFTTPTGYQSGPHGSGSGVRSGGSVQFRSTSQTANYGIHQAGGEFSTTDPVVVIPVARGLARSGGVSTLVPGTAGTLYATDMSTTGSPAIGTGNNNLRLQATRAQTGTIWGSANYGDKVAFTAAFFKRHTPVGPGGLGQIYLTNVDTGTANAAQWVKIPNVGSNPRGTADNTADPETGYDYFHDVSAYPAVYKVGLGDIDLSADRKTLYAVNLNDRQLYAVPVNPPAALGGNPTAGTPVAIAMPLSLPGASAGGACAQDQVRPFGLHTTSLGVWATLTCTGPTAADLRGYVYRYDETTNAWGTSPAIEFSLAGNRSRAWTGAFSANSANWHPWADDFAGGASGSSFSYTQPMLSDLEFDSNGDMSIGIKDRTGDRVGMDAGNLTTSGTGSTNTYEGFNAGDLLRACASGSTWVLESNGSCGAKTGYGVGNGQGPGGGEFYMDDYPLTGSASHPQAMLGTAEQIPGFTDLVASAYDPLSSVRVSGFRRVSNTNGGHVAGVDVTGDGRGDQTTCAKCQGTFGKADGLGDIEAMLADAPIEIGNRVWKDLDRDGVQDAGETPAANVTVHLYEGASTTPVGTATTDPNGEYYFNATNVTGGLKQSTAYRIAVDAAADFTGTGTLKDWLPTSTDVGTNDTIDSDGTPNASGFSQKTLTTGGPGADDHTFDFGYTLRFDLALRKTVAAGQSTPVEPGDPVTFTITVFNQGADSASNVTVTDKLPPGTTLSDANWTDNGDGTAKRTIAGPIAPGASATANITLTVDRPAPDGDITNTAEISSAFDGGGNPAVDVDSTPDTDLGNDTLVDDEITKTPATGDEDDHDIAKVPLQTPGFDLALRKALATGQSSQVQRGDDVTFTITVFNQGAAPAKEVRVTDYLPANTSLDDADWTDNGNGTAVIQLPGTLAVGGQTSVDITVKIDADAPTGAFDNYAEISQAKDRFGGDGQDADSTPDTTRANDVMIDDEIALTPLTGDEDDHDIATVTFEQFDLALRKTTAATQVRKGDLVPYTITVFNQGSLAATDIEVTDYLPAELQFNLADNAGWTVVGGKPTTTVPGPLAPGASTSVTIKLEVIANAVTIDNFAEISAATGPGAMAVTDIDSTPDTTNTDSMTDNVIDNANGDEDDHDIASIGAPSFDLALRKTTTATTVAPGDLVPFSIRVYNQGQQSATDIVVTDAVPAGMTFSAADNPGWVLVGAKPTTTVAGPLAPGADTVVTIKLKVGANAVGGTLTNTAEISAATDETGAAAADIDSTPDTDLAGDPLVDDVIDNAGGDEDDHDVAAVTVDPFDLALRKTLASGQASTVEPGDSVRFAITVFNQGQVAAGQTTITDTLPSGTSLDDANWTDNGDGTASRTISGLAVGGQTTITIQLKVTRPAANATYRNTAEISATVDSAGRTRVDEDSTPDGVDTDPLVDDVIDNAAGDEDDHDIADISVVTPPFDLALRKSLASGQATKVRPGQDATFTITVFNQGQASAKDITITDTLPTGLTLHDGDWTDNGDGTASITLAGPLASGSSTSIDLTVTVDADAQPGALVNDAEISAAQDRFGGAGNDVDSDPDTDATNDDLIDDEITRTPATGDEDDHDVAELTVPTFDLALRKTVADDIVAPGQLVPFTITVFNQGEIPASNIVVTDSLPAGLSFDAADNSGWTLVAGKPTRTIAGPLAPGDQTAVTISLQVTATSASASLVNDAEISAATDDLGVARTDIDSTPDTDATNDNLIDDEITKTPGTGDEDDHDIASVRLFDLALRKTTTAGAVHVGDDVPFTITVFNQGLVSASSFTVTDYLPSQLSFSPVGNPGWSLVGGKPTITVSSALAPGDSTSVTLHLTVANNAAVIDNYAEISAATGPNQHAVTDVDSTPDTTVDDDDLIDNQIDGPGDEDDHDIASVSSKPFDLALKKTTAADIVSPGELVPFTVRVYNQGEQAASSIVVTDEIPAGMTFTAGDNPGWALVSGQPTTTIAGPLAAGADTAVTIALRVSTTAKAGDLVNTAEISSAIDEDGRDAVDIDSFADTDLANDVLVDDELHNVGGDEDDHDIAGVTVEPFDLALRKTLAPGQAATVEPGDAVAYTVTVFNQGQVAAKDIVVTDTLPDHTTLSDPNWTDNGDGTASRTIAGPIQPGSSISASLELLIDRPAPNGDIVNDAEISSATDTDGVTRVDEDSTPDTDATNDELIDDEITETPATGDEDDHDIAEVTLFTPEFDLALRKTLASGQASEVRPGQDATFDVTVFNQGEADATSIQLIDELPEGTTLHDPDWTDNSDGTASITLPGTLAAGAQTTVQLTLTVNADTAPGNLVNNAEIAAANDRFGGAGSDIDSTPDGDLGNDQLADDVIDKTPATGDEDDHDIAEITVPTFDLALRKTTSADIVAPGQLVPFTITVFNQGEMPAKDIEITDTIPAGFSFSAAENSGWTLVGGKPTTTITDTVAPGASTAVTIELTVVASAADGAYDNLAEISGATDDLGIGRPDIDSTPDRDETNDALIDDEITKTSATGDEDDHDIASVRIFDLALRKTTDVGQVQVGDLVPFEVEVFNQGNVAATGVQVTDYLPAELSFDAADNTGWTDVAGNPTTTVAGSIDPGDSVTLTINLRVTANADRIDNLAEISAASGPQGVAVTDIDSTPDTDPSDDPLVDNAIDNTGGDQDDHDIASIGSPTFDLALRKTLSSGQPATVWPGDDVSYDITVFNQGAQAATDIVVTDAVPEGLAFDPAANSGWTLAGGQPTTTIAGPLEPGASTTVTIVLAVDGDVTPRMLRNTAEISAATDEDDRPGLDADSSPDTDLAGDTMVDDVIDNAGGDEDDHDVADVTVPVFDLALRKTLADGQASTVYVGDQVHYDITVFNQGSIAATDVAVADTLPAGLSFDTDDNPGWTLAGGQPTTTVAGPIAAGGSATVELVLTVTGTGDSLVNNAEITEASDGGGTVRPDIDSTPDTDPANDELADDVIDETPATGDEDDHDVAEISAPAFDLALRKALADGQASTVYAGQDATFTITVFNQGDVTARNIEVTDDLPTGLSFNAARNPGWTNTDGVLTTTIPGPLAPGASAQVDITLGVTTEVGASVDNLAEISGAEDSTGRTPPDVDSTPDADLTDDELTDDEIGSTPTGDPADEDDNDIATITTPVWDLALRKTLASGQSSTVRPGQPVGFTITVFNQGTVPAYDVLVRDAIPAGLTFDAAGNDGWSVAGGAITTTVAGPIAPGSSASVDVSLTLSDDAPPSLTNIAEIVRAVDGDGNEPPDVDSIVDEDEHNDTTVDDQVDNEDGDEDDNDLAVITIVEDAPTTTVAESPTTTIAGQSPVATPTEEATPADIVRTGLDIAGLVPVGTILILVGAAMRRRWGNRWA